MSAPDKCRLILVLPDGLEDPVSSLTEALAGGDVASLIIPSPADAATSFQKLCEKLVPIAQQAGVAAIIANDTRVAGRCNADGIHIDLPGGDVGMPQLADALAQYSPQKIVGAGSVKTRHMALSLGELNPGYVFFGKLNGDTKPQAHPKMLNLAEWWSEMVEIPGICMAGSDVESIIDVAKTGIDFAALSSAIFHHKKGAKEAVRQANALLAEHAPEFNYE